MTSKPKLIYWDSVVFLSYFSRIPGRFETIINLLEQVKNSDDTKIVTSILTKVEVAHASTQYVKNLDLSAADAAIDAMWTDKSVLRIAEFHDYIAIAARDMMRLGQSEGWKLKPLDAIHLATAQFLDVSEIHTYDDQWSRYSNALGIVICEPYVNQPRLPSM